MGRAVKGGGSLEAETNLEKDKQIECLYVKQIGVK